MGDPSTSMLKLQLEVPDTIGMLVLPDEAGVPVPVSITGCAPVVVNIPDPVKVIPFDKVDEILYAPNVVTFTFMLTVFAAVKAVPAV